MAINDIRETGEIPGQPGQGTGGNSGSSSGKPRNSVDGVVLETVIVISDEQSGAAYVGQDQETCDRQGIGAALGRVEDGDNRNLNNSVDVVALETVVVVSSGANECVSEGHGGQEVKSNESGLRNVLAEKSKAKVLQGDKQSCLIDKKGSGGGGGGGGGGGFKESLDGELVCRICHLSSEQTAASATTATATMDLIQLGCGCKDELGIAHGHCAEAWFKLRGNRLCEICGQTAQNVTGFGDNRFMEAWNERRFIRGSGSSSERGGGCWRGQPFCNFLMACLVIAFVLPWFLRVNMF